MLLLALFEVLTVAVAWGVERLVRHPDIADRLAASDADDTYVSQVASEVLRARPAVIGAFRRLEAPADMHGMLLPAGVLAMAALPLIHHHGQHHSDPSAFRPARFAHAPPAAWLPFGASTRRCLGAHLGHVALRTVLPTILARTRLRPVFGPAEKARLVGTLLVPDRLVTVRQARSARPQG